MRRRNIEKLPRKLKKATKDLLSNEQSIIIDCFGANIPKLRFRSGVRLKSHHRRLVAKFDDKLRTAFEAMTEVYREGFIIQREIILRYNFEKLTNEYE